MAGATDENDIYVILLSYNVEFIKMNAELNEIKRYVLTEEELYSINEASTYRSYPIELENLINVKNNKLNLFLGDNILQFDLSLSKYNVISANELNIYELFPKIYKQFYFETYIYDNNDNYQIYIENVQPEYELEAYQPDSITLKVLDNTDYLLWQKVFEEYEDDEYITISDAKIVDNYIVILKDYLYTEESSIIIYDFEGNLIQEINTHNMYNKITANSLGFSVLNSTDYKNKCEARIMPNMLPQVNVFNYATSANIQPINDDDGYCYFKMNEEFYYLYYLVDSKVTGNGKIEYPNKAKAGKQVSFKTQPDPNFTVKSVTVKDINGNTVNVNNGSFTMPEDDVVIEVEFVSLKNPYTKGGLIGIMTIIICITVGIYLQSKRQKLNN